MGSVKFGPSLYTNVYDSQGTAHMSALYDSPVRGIYFWASVGSRFMVNQLLTPGTFTDQELFEMGMIPWAIRGLYVPVEWEEWGILQNSGPASISSWPAVTVFHAVPDHPMR